MSFFRRSAKADTDTDADAAATAAAPAPTPAPDASAPHPYEQPPSAEDGVLGHMTHFIGTELSALASNSKLHAEVIKDTEAFKRFYVGVIKRAHDAGVKVSAEFHAYFSSMSANIGVELHSLAATLARGFEEAKSVIAKSAPMRAFKAADDLAARLDSER